MDVVYVLGTGSRWDNNEIRYSLRSLEKHLTGFRNVWVIGEDPKLNVNHIPMEDPTDIPDTNIMLKLTTACNVSDISEDFLYVNDDHFLLDHYLAPEFPYYYFNTLKHRIERYTFGEYIKRCKNTLNYLTENNLPIKYFDIHTPIIYNKKLFIEHVYNKWKEPCVIKSMYANSLRIEGVEMKDNKIHTHPRTSDRIFSTLPKVTAHVQRWLDRKFPDKSRFE